MKDLPIGVFDSGIGGLTVVKEIIKTLPNESLIYLGDTARVPYGNRDDQTIKQFSKELVGFLLKQKVKALVVACNTMSAVALSEIKKASNVPVVDVINPTVDYVTESFPNKEIGVIATRATLNSKAYQDKFEELGIAIKTREVPLFVPLIEEGILEGDVTESIVKMYLGGFSVDALILGSTHYPLLSQAISKFLGPQTAIVNTAHPASVALLNTLFEEKLLSRGSRPSYKFYVTDETQRTEEIAKIFFDHNLPAKLQRTTL